MTTARHFAPSLPNTPEHAIERLRELWLTDSDLSFLRDVDANTLLRIAGEVARDHARISESQRPLYEAMARATRVIPGFLLAKFSGTLSPYVQARICQCLDAKSAAALARVYEPALLAEISLHLEPGFAAQIAALTQIEPLAAIANVLIARGLWRRLSEIADALAPELLAKLVERIRDPEHVAGVALHMTATEKFGQVLRRLDTRLQRPVIEALERLGGSAALAAAKAR